MALCANKASKRASASNGRARQSCSDAVMRANRLVVCALFFALIVEFLIELSGAQFNGGFAPGVGGNGPAARFPGKSLRAFDNCGAVAL